MDGGDFNQVIVSSSYEARGVFSFDSLKRLSATFWLIKDGEAVQTSLGAASYKIYDKTGVEVATLSETGLLPNLQGQYITAPVNASMLADLTHYVAEVSIDYEGETRINNLGIIIGD